MLGGTGGNHITMQTEASTNSVFESLLLHPCASSGSTCSSLPPKGYFRPRALRSAFPLCCFSRAVCYATSLPTLLRKLGFETFIPFEALLLHTSVRVRAYLHLLPSPRWGRWPFSTPVASQPASFRTGASICYLLSL